MGEKKSEKCMSSPLNINIATLKAIKVNQTNDLTANTIFKPVFDNKSINAPKGFDFSILHVST